MCPHRNAFTAAPSLPAADPSTCNSPSPCSVRWHHPGHHQPQAWRSFLGGSRTTMALELSPIDWKRLAAPLPCGHLNLDPTWMQWLQRPAGPVGMIHLCFTPLLSPLSQPTTVSANICKLWPACDNRQLLLRHQLVELLCLTHAGATYPPIKTTDSSCSQDGSASHSCIWILVLHGFCWNDLWRASTPLRMEFPPQLDSSPRPSSHARARLTSESDMIMLSDSKIT